MDHKLQELGLRRFTPVGKKVGDKVWVHINYSKTLTGLSPEDLAKGKEIPFTPSIIRFDIKTNEVAFIECSGFDNEPEPIIGRSFVVKNDGSTKLNSPPSDPLIYHHKWMFVLDDYEGFNVSESKCRSIWWKSALGTDRGLSSRIGRLSFWKSWLETIVSTNDFWSNDQQTITSSKTSINSKKAPKIISSVKKLNGWKKGGVNLDLGGGKYDSATDKLLEYGVTNLIYDPYNRSEEENLHVREVVSREKVDTVTISNVLNVIKEDSVKLNLIQQAKESLKPNGKLFVTVYEGDRSGRGKLTGQDQWQENKKLSEYRLLLSSVFGQVASKYGVLICVNS